MVFNQTMIMNTNTITSLVLEDCFSGVEIMWYADRINIVAQPGLQQKCSDSYFQSIPYTYDRWYYSFGASELADATGFVFIQKFDYQFVPGEAMNITLSCAQLSGNNCALLP